MANIKKIFSIKENGRILSFYIHQNGRQTIHSVRLIDFNNKTVAEKRKCMVVPEVQK